MDHVMKDCLMVSRQHRLADVCRRLHTPKISNIVVCGSSGEVHGVIPLWHILQLLQGNRAFTDRMIASLTLEEISAALDAALCFDAQHSRWKGMRIFAGEHGGGRQTAAFAGRAQHAGLCHRLRRFHDQRYAAQRGKRAPCFAAADGKAYS